MKRLPLLVLVLLSLVFLALLAPYVLEPELYTKENGSYTASHSDPAIMSAFPYDRSTDIQAMMQELLDAPQQIVLNIRIRDFEEAEREFEKYKEQSGYFGKVVVRLDLSESAVGDFRRENRKNMEALERMINESVRFDEVNRLEIKYRDEENPALLYTVVLEGEAIQNTLNKTSTQFAEREPDILAISTELGLNTTKYLEAVETMEAIVEEDRRVQQQREERQREDWRAQQQREERQREDWRAQQLPLPPASLSLSVSPQTGRYLDILRVAGMYSSGDPVTLVLDSRDWQTVVPDEKGVFSTTLTIGRIREGQHVLFATTGTLYSNLVTFSVIPSDTVLSFRLYQGTDHWDEVLFSGKLFTGEIPVAAAPVRILVDESEAAVVETDAAGYYSGSVNLTEGNHMVQAVFDDPGFPLNPSESELREVDLAPSVPFLLAVGVGAGALVLASIGALWYVRKRSPPALPEQVPAPSEPVLSLTEGAPTGEGFVAPPSPMDTLIRYKELCAAGDWSGAALVLYRSVIDRLMLADTEALTPREVASRVATTPAGEAFGSFVTRYEEVRYGGMPLQLQDMLVSFWNAVLAAFEAGGGA